MDDCVFSWVTMGAIYRPQKVLAFQQEIFLGKMTQSFLMTLIELQGYHRITEKITQNVLG